MLSPLRASEPASTGRTAADACLTSVVMGECLQAQSCESQGSRWVATVVVAQRTEALLASELATMTSHGV